jgi:2-iminobutanoate/2-iminopropanoate deaminase
MPTAITSPNSPAPLGPYSQAVRAGQTVYLSGQVGLDPATGKAVSDGVVQQTEQALNNMAAVLQAAGLGMADVVKTTIFLADMADFAAVNQVYGRHFAGAVRPARSTVQVAGLGLGLRVEIEAVAVAGEPGPGDTPGN